MKKAKSTLSSVLLVCLSLIWLSPIYIILANSFKSRDEMYVNPLGMPVKFSLEYYSGAMEKMNFLRAFGVSLVITIVSVAIIVVLCAMAAWMMARSDGKLSKAIYYTLILTMLIPFQTLMMPLMQEMNSLEKLLGIQIKDTIGGLIFMYIGFGAGMGVFMFYGFVKGSLPRTLEEAAIIDGCNTWQLFWRVVFPLMKPTIITLVILDVIWIWNDYLLPSLTLKSASNRTIPIGTQIFFGQYTIEWNMAMAALMLTIIPVVVFYLCAQKHIVKGVAAGAVKG
ncbi:MAG: carbohydrate ABC transporter permease [Clostridiales bacterium]|nr:carbohydrate ABC transporter permease [Clostridiales bacterium]MCI7019038.1 carbohydrate ABC transporter permease [Clostridiales bacterium]